MKRIPTTPIIKPEAVTFQPSAAAARNAARAERKRWRVRVSVKGLKSVDVFLTKKL
jgi:hypothetical protein